MRFNIIRLGFTARTLPVAINENELSGFSLKHNTGAGVNCIGA
jgi:hypothetical protein